MAVTVRLHWPWSYWDKDSLSGYRIGGFLFFPSFSFSLFESRARAWCSGKQGKEKRRCVIELWKIHSSSLC
jgi:hypothetical protein